MSGRWKSGLGFVLRTLSFVLCSLYLVITFPASPHLVFNLRLRSKRLCTKSPNPTHGSGWMLQILSTISHVYEGLESHQRKRLCQKSFCVTLTVRYTRSSLGGVRDRRGGSASVVAKYLRKLPAELFS